MNDLKIRINFVETSDADIKGDKSKTNVKNVAELQQDTNQKDVRNIKLKQDIYYGPKNSNKNKFVRMYKKLNLVWKTEKIDGVLVDGWFNKDKSQYIIKLPEEGDYKRFKFYGCDKIYDYFIGLGAVTFELSDKDNISSSTTKDIDEDYKFVGADLWAHYRTKQLLKNMPDNWGIKWK